MSDDAINVDDWLPGTFPDPNPYFPPPPRGGGRKDALIRLLCRWCWLASVPAGLLILWLYTRGVFGGPDRMIIILMVSLGLIVAGPMAFWLGRKRYAVWDAGLIVPALVIKARPSRKLKWYERTLLAIVGLLTHVGALLEESATTSMYTVRYMLGGDVWEEKLAIAKPHTAHALDDVIWIAVRPAGGRSQAIEQVAPEDLRLRSMPSNIANCARVHLKTADPAQLKEAAKATRKAYDKATRYERRPD